MEVTLSKEESQFVQLRNSIKGLWIELWIRVSRIHEIVYQIIDLGKLVIENVENISQEELTYQIEATISIFHNLILGVRDVTKVTEHPHVVDHIKSFFLSPSMKDIFSGENTHMLVSKRYLDCIVQLKYFFEDEETKKKLWYDALGIFFQPNVFQSKDPHVVCYYLTTFVKFIEK